MSKITLEPNDSGAGTFSIVSPDSNTNRTLTLPDEAGKLLSTGNDDPAEVFKQSNILGTVSESEGVPTGAIIERGSNSNGDFVKFADGLGFCFGSVTISLDQFDHQIDMPMTTTFIFGSTFAPEYSNFGTIVDTYSDMHISQFGSAALRLVMPSQASFTRFVRWAALVQWY